MEESNDATGTQTVYVAPAVDGMGAVTFDKEEAESSSLSFNEYRVPPRHESGNGALLENAEFTGNVIEG